MINMISNVVLTGVVGYLAFVFSGLLAGIVAGFVVFGLLVVFNRESVNRNF